MIICEDQSSRFYAIEWENFVKDTKNLAEDFASGPPFYFSTIRLNNYCQRSPRPSKTSANARFRGFQSFLVHQLPTTTTKFEGQEFNAVRAYKGTLAFFSNVTH